MTAIPKLMEALAIKGSILSIDAMGCHTEIAEKIIEKEADYILSIKGNQVSLEEGITDTIKFAKPIKTYEDIEYGHGRIKTRVCYGYTYFSHIENWTRWKDLQCIAKVDSNRNMKSTEVNETETQLYICSFIPCAEKIEKCICTH